MKNAARMITSPPSSQPEEMAVFLQESRVFPPLFPAILFTFHQTASPPSP
jgi:hypothetical protein